MATELEQQLAQSLTSMLEWAQEVSDEYLDGDPDVKSQYLADLDQARQTLKLVK